MGPLGPWAGIGMGFEPSLHTLGPIPGAPNSAVLVNHPGQEPTDQVPSALEHLQGLSIHPLHRQTWGTSSNLMFDQCCNEDIYLYHS